MNFAERKADEYQKSKAAQWAEIQKHDPQSAKILIHLAKVFGKIKLREVKWK